MLDMVCDPINSGHFQVPTPQIILGVEWAWKVSRPIITLQVTKIVILVLEGGA